MSSESQVSHNIPCFTELWLTFEYLGLDNFIFKSGTLTSTLACPPFLPISAHSVPIVQVAIEPMRPSDDTNLQEGLQLLNRSDPCVEVQVSNTTGEFLLRTAGEVHLHRCLTDLKERYAGIELRVSQPTVQFLETVAQPLPGQQQSEDECVISPGTVKIQVPNSPLSFTIRCHPLSEEAIDCISKHEELVRKIHRVLKQNQQCGVDIRENVAHFKEKLKEQSTFNVDNVLSFGPFGCESNVLTCEDSCSLAARRVWDFDKTLPLDDKISIQTVYNSIVNGFQLAATAGPICEEPMRGVCFTILDAELDATMVENYSMGSLNGHTVSLVKEICRRAFSSLPQRLMVAMYSCTVQTSPETLGKLHGVIARRFGKVTNEDTNDTCTQFFVSAAIPVIESFGLADELRKKTSGLVLDPQLKFSHWEVLEADPTVSVLIVDEEADVDETLEMSLHHQARRYMLAVRRRKGLPTGEQLVVKAEKQRNLSKKK